MSNNVTSKYWFDSQKLKDFGKFTLSVIFVGDLICVSKE